MPELAGGKRGRGMPIHHPVYGRVVDRARSPLGRGAPVPLRGDVPEPHARAWAEDLASGWHGAWIDEFGAVRIPPPGAVRGAARGAIGLDVDRGADSLLEDPWADGFRAGHPYSGNPWAWIWANGHHVETVDRSRMRYECRNQRVHVDEEPLGIHRANGGNCELYLLAGQGAQLNATLAHEIGHCVHPRAADDDVEQWAAGFLAAL